MIDFNSVTDCKSLDENQLTEISSEIRERIIDAVSKNGGHLASNLGVVELTLALHRVFDLPKDKLIFDVSHQSYVHKLLTGRGAGFEKLRNADGVSGFQLRNESEYDFFGGGHSGTSISAAIGYAEACKLNGSNNYAVAVVGDGSFTNGMIFEALNNASKENLRLVVVLNDNEMSISENVGGLSSYFGKLRSNANYYRIKRKVKKGFTGIKLIDKPIAFLLRGIKRFLKKLLVKTTLFENLGIDYMGPVDGHDIKKLEAVLREAKYLEAPVIVHVCTQKGKGYKFAEEKPELYHSVSSFDKEKGVVPSEVQLRDNEFSGFSQCFGANLTALAEKNDDIVAISAAMCEGTGLTGFKEHFPDRFFDVGIAEEHAVTFAAGLAASGKRPVVALYSTFMQRAYDQVIHDVAIQGLPVIFAIDRAGFVAGDGVTHQGVFDLGALIQIPEFTVYTPETYSDIADSLSEAISLNSPCAIRYHKGNEIEYDRGAFTEQSSVRYARFGKGGKIAIVSYGRTVANAYGAAKILENEFEVTVIGIKKVKPLNKRQIFELCKDCELVVFVEEQIKNGGISEHIVSESVCLGIELPQIEIIALDENFPIHASVAHLHKLYGMDAESIASLIKNKYK